MLSPGSGMDADRIFSPFDLTRPRAVVAAVSGGSDSFAMLLLLQRRLNRISPRPRLLTVTVDHGLRAEARAEAETVARFCEARGIPHRIVHWTGERPGTGIAAAARFARYGLLAEAATAADADVIVTGHTADDQAETVAMRQARGDGRGLAGMAPATLFEGRAWIVRPLLGTRRERLRAFLGDEGVPWIDDPTNVDASYERARMRRALQSAGGIGQVEALLQVASNAGAERQALGVRAAALIAAHAERLIEGLLHLTPGFAAKEDDEAVLLALRVLLAVAGGTEHLPDAGRTMALIGRLRTGPVRATLSRCMVDARKAGIFLYRERRGLPEGPAAAGTVWDGRHEIVEGEGARTPLSVSVLRPIDKLRTQDLDTSPPLREGRGWEPNSTPALAPRNGGRGVEPGGRNGEGGDEARDLSEKGAGPSFPPPGLIKAVRATMPQLGGSELVAMPILAPWRRFLPCFDLAVARAAARLVGAGDIPSPPFASHNGKEA